MRAEERTARAVSEIGKHLGAKLGELVDAMGDASREAGPGMSNKDDNDLAETILDALTDCASFKLYTDAARDLLIAEAKLEFYGLHAPKLDRAKWKAKSDEAFREVAGVEAA